MPSMTGTHDAVLQRSLRHDVMANVMLCVKFVRHVKPNLWCGPFCRVSPAGITCSTRGYFPHELPLLCPQDIRK